MKCLLIVAIAFLAVVSADEEWKPIANLDVLDVYMKDCFNESGAKKEQLRNMFDGKDHEEPETLAYALCVVKKCGFFTEEKGYNVNRFMAQVDFVFEGSENVRDIVTGCLNSGEPNNTPGLRALLGLQCLVKSRIDRKMKERKIEGWTNNDEIKDS